MSEEYSQITLFEDAEDNMSMDLDMDWENLWESDTKSLSEGGEPVGDALIKCLNQYGCVNIEFISAVSGKDCSDVIDELGDAIYQNPRSYDGNPYGGWELADEYLSGNIRKKIIEAKKADERHNGLFRRNVEALEMVLPPMVSSDEIYVTLGSPWVPPSVIEDFLRFLIGKYIGVGVTHDTITGTWDVGIDAPKTWLFKFQEKYGTNKITALEVFERTLNLKSVKIMDEVPCQDRKRGYKRVINQQETAYAVMKQKQLISDFQSWVWSDNWRSDELVRIYDENYACIRRRHYNGSFLDFTGITPDIELYPYQKNAVARILFSKNTLLAHEVGSGKTFIMIAAGMELRRLKLGRKEEKLLYVVPNNLLGQWNSLFLRLYPSAKVLCIGASQFTPAKRQNTLEVIQRGAFDAVIMTYSCFNSIKISKEAQRQLINSEIQRASRIGAGDDEYTKGLKRYVSRLYEKRSEIIAQVEDENEIYFDKLGITRLFLDEAHNFKNVPITTKIEHVMGINSAGSSKCKDMLDKVSIIQADNNGGGIVFATGTPITNSITDAYIMQRYLQNGELEILGLECFDSWVAMFAEMNTAFEIDVDTSSYRMATRFSKFHNIPELTNMLASVADFHEADSTSDLPVHDGYEDVVIPKTQNFSNYLKTISSRADDIRHGRVNRTEDNMLKVTTDGRKAALDLRLVDTSYPFSVVSKVFSCAENVSRIYKETAINRSTQLVFCDTSTPGKGFNIYSELKYLLIKMGVDENEIAFVHDANTEKRREKLFEAVREGEIRVLLGSTFKLGLGVNVQDKLIALHHLDIPWRPADMVQREGRIIRQGNENKEVRLFRYITEGSFDAYSWQLLETKQRFIVDILSGITDKRVGSDIDDTVLSYAEVKALAVGNPLIKKRVEVANELSKYKMLQNKLINRNEEYEKLRFELPETIKKNKAKLDTLTQDNEFYLKNKRQYSIDERREISKLIFDTLNEDEPLEDDEFLCFYQEFALIAPKGAFCANPVLTVEHIGRYHIQIGLNSMTFMRKIDRVLDGLSTDLEAMKKTYKGNKEKLVYINTTLNTDDNYADKIRELKETLEGIDKRLGVKEE